MGRSKNRRGKSSKMVSVVEQQEEEMAEKDDDNRGRCFLCWEECDQRCSGCDVFYCSDEHRRLHRPENLCFPFRVDFKEGVGRCMVATRDIQPLELILYDRSVALGPKAGCAPVCLQCLKPIAREEEEEGAAAAAAGGPVNSEEEGVVVLPMEEEETEKKKRKTGKKEKVRVEWNYSTKNNNTSSSSKSKSNNRSSSSSSSNNSSNTVVASGRERKKSLLFPPMQDNCPPAAFLCPGCGWPLCGPQCLGGRAHSAEECSILAKGTRGKVSFRTDRMRRPHPHYRCVAPLRLLLLRDSQPEVHKRLGMLMDHNRDRREKDPELWGIYEECVTKFLRDDCGLAERFTSEEVERATGVLWTNSFACAGGGGQAVYPTFSFASHSCVSNCNPVVFPNRHLALQSKVRIARGEELTISYVSSIQGTMRRRSKLRDKWFFSCVCRRCSDPSECGSHSSTLVCQAGLDQGGKGRRCGGNVMEVKSEQEEEGVWACSKCGAAIRAEDVMYLENSLAKQIQRASSSSSSLSALRRLLDDHRSLLHPNHYLLLLLKRHLVAVTAAETGMSELTLKELQEIKTLCEEVLSVLNVIEPGYNRDRGLMLRHLSEASKVQCRKMFQADLIRQDVFTRRVQECMLLFEESQRCMSMLVKKK